MLIKECWKLNGQEPFLALTWAPDFSQTCSLCRMLMKHKNIWFTQIPDKTNDVIFLKSPKTLFWHHFWSFLPNEDFLQKICLCHTQPYMDPWHHVKFQKKIMSQFQENLRTGRTDGQTLFYRILPDEAAGPIKRHALIILEEK